MPRQKKEKTKAGKLSMKDKLALINKRAGMEVAYNLKNDNPTEVTEWIPTGSRWLDSIICRGKLAGVPVGRITEIAGMESSGKSYMAAQVAANAQKQGFSVVYFDSESAIDPSFLENAGCDIDNLIYAQAASVEMVLETIEQLLTETDDKYLFVWDSLAFTPSISDLEGDFNPQSSMAVKPRILSKGLSKLTVPIANSNSVLLVLNQLKTNIGVMFGDNRVEPGGKALPYHASSRIWLTQHKGKANGQILNEKKQVIGFHTSAKTMKSRFGPSPRSCEFDVLFDLANDRVGVDDEGSWLSAIAGTPGCVRSGAWYTIDVDGEDKKFQSKDFLKLLEDKKFKERVLDILEDECKIGKK